MNLSDLFGGYASQPTQTAFITGAVTDSIITASPAVLIGFMGGAIATSSTNIGYYNLIIQNGTNKIFETACYPPYPASAFSSIPNGVDCPNGITATVAAGHTGTVSLARVSIYYILK